MTIDPSPSAGAGLPPVSELSYEDAREQLVKVVSQLEAGGVSLEQSLALWERGEELADHCEQWLEGARKRLAAARSQPEEQGGSQTQA
ncbi:exodeoxyribonuclease VII small subunit [Arthrobacter pigmenti]|uniref:Exodeoxyribonuclease 7 small subunit n=1 Tax=Arthrobacter pigmenti TaxID=271432 RepID=A0A846RXW8_9MICC|nr:exodeoxyribonuclease VII small subunit [Arthrobacter pigmenti]NJC23051.1 exodeoxyribonuclease VII small subunit [Arthrobacter pigmenti]